MVGPTRRQIESAAEAARLGLTIELQARYVGISLRSYYNWRARGEAEDIGPYHDLVAALSEAEAAGAAAAMAAIVKAYREGSWQAAAWIMERRHGYVRTERREVDMEVTAIDPREAIERIVLAIRDTET